MGNAALEKVEGRIQYLGKPDPASADSREERAVKITEK